NGRSDAFSRISQRTGQRRVADAVSARTSTAGWVSVRENAGADGNALLACRNSTATLSPVMVEGTESPSIRSPSWAWIARAQLRHVLRAALGSDADAPCLSAHPLTTTSSRVNGRVGIQALSAWWSVRVIARRDWKPKANTVWTSVPV